MKSAFVEWILRNAFRDCIEEVSGFLEETRLACAALSLATLKPPTGNDWNRVVQRPTKAFHKLPFPTKLQRLSKDYGVIPDTGAMLESLNRARACLVHRRGVVDEQDCNEPWELVVRWAQTRLVTYGPSGDSAFVAPGVVIGAGSNLVAQTRPEERRFKVGEPLSFSAANLTGVLLTIQAFGSAVVQRVLAFGAARGVAAENKSSEI